jgi:GH43 family beta-xylosidase
MKRGTVLSTASLAAVVALAAACSSRDPSSGSAGSDLASSGTLTASKVVKATNPVLGDDHPDPHVLRVVQADGTARYYLTSTVGTSDIPIYTSTDLVHWTVTSQAFGGLTAKGDGALEINGAYFCNIWAPQIVAANGSYLLSFTAQRYTTPQKTCPDYNEDSGVYLASAASPEGPYATPDHPWEPLVGGGQIASCSSTLKQEIPHSPDVAFHDCEGGQCDQIMRLDSDVFHDPKDGTYWLSFAWYTNDGPLTAWEQSNFGEHVSVTQLNTDDPWSVVCKSSVPQVYIANPHDDATTTKLAAACPRCGEMLAMDRQRDGTPFLRGGFDWGVNEGPNLFRHGDYVYAMISGSVWDSAYYSIFWIAAPTVPELAYSNTKRLVGRFLIPSKDQSFGHGTFTLGPDGVTPYFIHHHLDHTRCLATGDCSRDVYVSPITFEDHGDGLGPVYISARFPAEDLSVSVTVPAASK